MPGRSGDAAVHGIAHLSKEKPSNIVASIRQRLLNLARERGEGFQLVLTRYALERLLYRLSNSPHGDDFLLKGAMLFQYWTGQPHRSTLDLDLSGRGEGTVARYEGIFREVCALGVDADGLTFLPERIHGEQIREEQRYAGVRIHGAATLGIAKIALQIDIGFGDVVTPSPMQITYPSLLNLPAAVLRAYPKETVIAEKYEAMVSLGVANSRMKDFYDVWFLSLESEFDGQVLADAVKATFRRRKTELPPQMPLALTPEFSRIPTKQAQWRAFVRKGNLRTDAPGFELVVVALADFLWPITQAAHTSGTFTAKWPKRGPWQPHEGV